MIIIPEIVDPEHRLGRHQPNPEHIAARLLTATADPTNPENSVTWTRHCAPFNQGNLGSCTGNASAGALMTDPFYTTLPKTGPFAAPLNEPTAVTIYSGGSKISDPSAPYPPNDNGSTGPAVAEYLEDQGIIESFNHTTDLPTSLAAMQKAPGIYGINWMTSFDTPLSTGECPLTAGATVRGGHEIQSYEVDVPNGRIFFYQSWGATWGGLGNGTFWLSFATLTSLFEAGADGTFFVPKS